MPIGLSGEVGSTCSPIVLDVVRIHSQSLEYALATGDRAPAQESREPAIETTLILLCFDCDWAAGRNSVQERAGDTCELRHASLVNSE